VGVVKLDLVLLLELRPVVIVGLFVPPNQISDSSTAEEVLLLQSQLLSRLCGVVGVQDTCDILSFLSLSDGAVVVTGVERVEVELIIGNRSPKSEIVAVECVVAGNGGVVCQCLDDLSAFPNGSLYSFVHVLSNVTVEPNGVGDVLSLNLPWVSLSEPEIWGFTLVSINNHLLEDTVVVPYSIAPCWDFKGSH